MTIFLLVLVAVIFLYIIKGFKIISQSEVIIAER